jgi:hypothetical protein
MRSRRAPLCGCITDRRLQHELTASHTRDAGPRDKRGQPPAAVPGKRDGEVQASARLREMTHKTREGHHSLGELRHSPANCMTQSAGCVIALAKFVLPLPNSMMQSAGFVGPFASPMM